MKTVLLKIVRSALTGDETTSCSQSLSCTTPVNTITFRVRETQRVEASRAPPKRMKIRLSFPWPICTSWRTGFSRSRGQFRTNGRSPSGSASLRQLDSHKKVRLADCSKINFAVPPFNSRTIEVLESLES